MDPCKQEIRIADLESKSASQNASISHLGDRLSDLVGEIRWHNRLILGVLISIVGYFLERILGG